MIIPRTMARGIVAAWATCCMASLAPRSAIADTSSDKNAAYTRTITDRANKLLATLKLDDPTKESRLRSTIVEHYRNLSEIHDTRDSKLQSAGGSTADPALAKAWKEVVGQQSDRKLFRLHRRFIARLSAELTPQQVDQIKDGMTYGVVPVTYNRYLELLPDLTKEQKSTIRAELLEAREYAMDAGSAEDKHQWFGKYKGRINNYLSAAGYDLKQAENEWAKRQSKPDSQPDAR